MKPKNIINAGRDGYLGILEAWRGSALVAWLDVRDGFEKLWLKVKAVGASDFFDGVEATYNPNMKLWRIVAPSSYFPNGGESVFKVIGKVVTSDDRIVIGEGKLRVRAGFQTDPNDYIHAIGKTAIVRGDGDKLYRVTARKDATGALAFKLTDVDDIPKWTKDTGVTPVNLSDFDGTYYAHDEETGFYRPLAVTIDEEGKPMLVSGDLELEGDDSFALDEHTGFYRLIKQTNDGITLSDKEVN